MMFPIYVRQTLTRFLGGLTRSFDKLKDERKTLFAKFYDKMSQNSTLNKKRTVSLLMAKRGSASIHGTYLGLIALNKAIPKCKN